MLPRTGARAESETTNESAEAGDVVERRADASVTSRSGSPLSDVFYLHRPVRADAASRSSRRSRCAS